MDIHVYIYICPYKQRFSRCWTFLGARRVEMHWSCGISPAPAGGSKADGSNASFAKVERLKTPQYGRSHTQISISFRLCPWGGGSASPDPPQLRATS